MNHQGYLLSIREEARAGVSLHFSNGASLEVSTWSLCKDGSERFSAKEEAKRRG